MKLRHVHQCYLLVLLQYPVILTKKDVDRPPMVILKRCTHHHLAVLVPIEVWNGGQRRAKARILPPVQNLEGPVQDKLKLRGERDSEHT